MTTEKGGFFGSLRAQIGVSETKRGCWKAYYLCIHTHINRICINMHYWMHIYVIEQSCLARYHEGSNNDEFSRPYSYYEVRDCGL
ncbi:MAG: hypothetical protein RLZZ627_1570 [Pseudomonadota bacterium]|jgi:hypothetical protein